MSRRGQVILSIEIMSSPSVHHLMLGFYPPSWQIDQVKACLCRHYPALHIHSVTFYDQQEPRLIGVLVTSTIPILQHLKRVVEQEHLGLRIKIVY